MSEERYVEARLLGSLAVRRPDGSLVGSLEWRTGKTMDLFRMLALEPGKVVRTETILQRLWPTVDVHRGRASLRTAASQIRRTIGVDCVERQLGGLVLRDDVWVDVPAFRALARQALKAADEDAPRRVVELTIQAEALYAGDFEAYQDDSAWVTEARESLTTLRLRLLTEAAECAIRAQAPRAAVRFAGLALQADPCAEGPHRSLMEAYARLGETQQALRVFEHCRAVLADELGASPSPQTKAVHVQVLRGGYGPLS